MCGSDLPRLAVASWFGKIEWIWFKSLLGNKNLDNEGCEGWMSNKKRGCTSPMVSQMVKMVTTSIMESLAEDVWVHQAAILLLNVVLCDVVRDWITFEGTFHVKDRLCKGNFPFLIFCIQLNWNWKGLPGKLFCQAKWTMFAIRVMFLSCCQKAKAVPCLRALK